MYLMYIDESGSTGLDLDNTQQPFFVLSGICIDAKNWHKLNDYFEEEKNKIYPGFKEIEIHTNELFNSNPKSHFYKNDWKTNLKILEDLSNLVASLEIMISTATIQKKQYKKHFGNNIIVDPYLYSFAILYEHFNDFLCKINDYGIIFCDELKKMETSLEILYPKLKVENRNIIEKTFYLNSKKNNFIQMADLCSFYVNKYNCIRKENVLMDNYKKEHCLKIYKKLLSRFGTKIGTVDMNYFDMYFK